MANLLLLNGPNLNLLGHREPQHYGSERLEQLTDRLQVQAQQLGHALWCEQSNAEHVLIEHVHQAIDSGIDVIIINPAAFTHTSIALRDAFLAVAIPFIEVHLSVVAAREPFRQVSYFSDIAIGVISGLGVLGYELALTAADRYLHNIK
jgi:3-dehydroquinate dehydratase II